MSDTNGNDSLKLEESIKYTFNIFKLFCDNNDLDEVIAECEVHANHDIYYSALKMQFLILKAMMIFDQADIDMAVESASKTIQLCDRIRKKGFLQNICKIIRTPDYDKYSELEMHAELTYAMCMAWHSVLSLLKCHTIVDLIRIVNRLRHSKNSYKECRLMLKHRTCWESDCSRDNFEAGIRLERGFRHLMISYFPPKVLSVVNFLGYRGCRSIAFNELTKTAFKFEGIYSRLAEVAILGYSLFVEAVGNCGKKRLDICDTILEKRLNTEPNSITYKIFKAKFSQMNGETETSIEEFENILLIDKQVFHKISHWELMWTYALKLDLDQCIKYAQLLRTQTLQSPAIMTYCEAVFRYFKAYKTNDKILKSEATELMKTVPTLRLRYIGKTITFEKGSIEGAKRYLANNEFLFLPIMSMLYNGNLFYLIDGNIPLLETHLEILEEEMKVYLKDLDNVHYIDYYLDSLFYKGVLLKHMRRLIEAQHCFNTVLEDMDKITENKSLIPQTLMELGLLQSMLNNKIEAKKFFNKALKHFSGYLNENLVHIRIHSALKELDVNTDSDDNKLHLNITEEYARRVSELTKLKK